MSPLNRLIKLGLAEKEAAVYLALLELGEAPVASIAKESGLKRPTTYIILAKLVQADLVQELKENMGSRFKANDPKVIEEKIQSRLQLVRERRKLLPALISQLNDLSQKESKKPVIKLYEGFNGISLLVDEVHNTNQVRFFGDGETCRSLFFSAREQLSNLQTVTAVIIVSSEKELKELTELAAKAQTKFLLIPLIMPARDLTNTSLVINDTKLFVFNDYPGGNGIIIENKDIVSTMTQIFKYVLTGAKQRKPACHVN